MWPVFYYRGFLTSSTFRGKQRLGEARYAVQVKKTGYTGCYFATPLSTWQPCISGMEWYKRSSGTYYIYAPSVP